MQKYRQRNVVYHNSPKECGLCGFTTQSLPALKLHMKYVHERKATNAGICYKCSKCDEEFDTEKKLTIHVKSHRVRVRGRNLLNIGV